MLVDNRSWPAIVYCAALGAVFACCCCSMAALLLSYLMTVHVAGVWSESTPKLALIPWPTNVTLLPGSPVILTARSKILYRSAELQAVAAVLSSDISAVHGMDLAIASGDSSAGAAGDIVLILAPAPPSPPGSPTPVPPSAPPAPAPPGAPGSSPAVRRPVTASKR